MSCPHAGNTTPKVSAQPSVPKTNDKTVSHSRDPTKLVHIPHDINILYAQPVQSHHEPYYDIKPSHLKRMNNVLRALVTEAGGSTVEHGIAKAKQLFKAGENPDLLRHALSIYLTHSRDAQHRQIIVPSLKQRASMLAPTAVAGPATLSIVGGQVVTPDTQQGPAILAYWREDYDYNDHHLHWHAVFPGTGVVVDGENVSVIDRQGELFLYMHSQMVTRYETEGICWNLPLVRPWNQYDDVLEYGYAPMPGFITSYGAYPPFSSWYAIKNPNIPDTPDAPVPRAKLEMWRDNIYQAIKDGFFWTKKGDEKKKYQLTADNCANLVGVVVEAESPLLLKLSDGYSFDEELYGNLHNYGHDKFAELSYHTYLTQTSQYSLMISNFGSPRDTAFWPWHKHIQYFGRLAAARFPQDLTEHRADVTLKYLNIMPQKVGSNGNLITFLGPPASNLMESLGKLDHEPYLWSVEITSTRSPPPTPANPQVITLRFFIAAQQLMEDYHNWIEMDKVSITLKSADTETSVRLDVESSVARKMGNYSEIDPQFLSSWCRCGWPQNMMLPVGKIEGMSFVGFCIATNDVVSEEVKASALSYCGAMNSERKYPDPRGMGYPFNRVWTQHLNGGPSHSYSKLSDIIKDTASFPFLTTTEFKIYRTTKPFLDSKLYPPHDPGVHVPTWEDTIKGYFKPRDVSCMKYEYGYDLSNYDDVMLHSGAIYDATVNKRMPLQMPPFTQDEPDPDLPMWTDEMCKNFRLWMLNNCPKGQPGPPPPPPPPTNATWEKPIKSYFLPADVQCMKASFDLSNHESVKKNAAAIYDSVSKGRMPKQMIPFTQSKPDPKHPMWTKEMCDTFQAWMKNGCP